MESVPGYRESVTTALSTRFWFVTSAIFVVNACIFAINEVEIVAIPAAFTALGAACVGIQEVRAPRT